MKKEGIAMKKMGVAGGVIFGMVAILSLSGCASIVAGGGVTHMNVATNPTGAKVTVKGIGNGEKVEKTAPFTVDLSKNSDYEFQIELQGYKSDTIFVRRTISGWFWGNLFIGGPIGMAIDYSSNSMWDHATNHLNIDLSKEIAQNPEQFEAKIPVALLQENGQTVIKQVPVIFHKIHG